MNTLLTSTINIYDTKIREVFDLAPNFIFFKDLNNKLIWANNAMVEAYHFTKQEFYDFFNNLINFDDETILKYAVDDNYVFTTGTPLYNIIERLYKCPTLSWINTSKIPIKNSDGVVMGLIGFSYDITEIREQTLEFETLIDSIPERILIFNYEGLCTKTFGYNKQNEICGHDIIGKNINEIECFSDIVDSLLEKFNIIKNDTTQIEHLECSLKNDTYFEISMSRYNGTKIMLIIRDIADRKKLDVLSSFNKSVNELVVYNQKILKTLGV